MCVCIVCARTCISAYDETSRKKLEATLADIGEDERCLHNVFWTLEGPARPRCQPALRYGALCNGTDNGEADTLRQHVCRARTRGKGERKEGRKSIYSTSSTLTVCWLHLDRSIHLWQREREAKRGKPGKKEETKKPVSIMHSCNSTCFYPCRPNITFFRITQPNCW